MSPTEEQIYEIQIHGNGWGNILHVFNLYAVEREIPPSFDSDTDALPYPLNVEKAKITTQDCQCIIVSKDKKYAYVADAEGD